MSMLTGGYWSEVMLHFLMLLTVFGNYFTPVLLSGFTAVLLVLPEKCSTLYLVFVLLVCFSTLALMADLDPLIRLKV